MVSVIVPTMGGGVNLQRCLRAIAENTGGDYEVIVVNGADEPLRRDEFEIQSHAPLTVVHNPKSCYASSVNKGVEASRGDYVTVPGIANDIEVTKGWLEPLVAALESNPLIGMAVPGVVEQGSGGYVVYGGFIFPDEAYNASSKVPPQYAGYGLVPRKVFDEIGGLDEGFKPIYLEDADYGMRLWSAGYVLAPCEKSILLHHHESEGRTGTAQANKDYFYKKWRIRVG